MEGKCCICGENKKLTYEHIPPRGAFNDKCSKVYNIEAITSAILDESRLPWEYDGLKYEQQQQGTGMFNLCGSCNSYTGKYYGNEYIKFVKGILYILQDKDVEKATGIHIKMKEFYPLRFAKQVLSLFCSTCGTELIEMYPNIKSLLLDKDSKGLDKDLRISMFILKTPRNFNSGIEKIYMDDGSIQKIAEINAFPLGFILEINPTRELKETNITNLFNDYDYDDFGEVDIKIPAFERNNIVPTDYRSKEEFLN